MSASNGVFTEKHFGRLVQRVLRAGVALSLLFFALGLVFTVSGNPCAGGAFTAGVLAMLLTPAARVLMLVYGFYRVKEPFMALAAVAVLALLLIAFLL